MVEIYKKQNDLTPEAMQVESFLRGLDDTNVMNALQSKKLKEIDKQKLEGKILKSELSNQLFEHMKNNSAPGIDGFTVVARVDVAAPLHEAADLRRGPRHGIAVAAARIAT